ncbi:hypothetical protein P7K49_023040 [Saguinus oedipus]|uniref:Uncharacterized protein n=1 Tax=Saguinus oedipus TaxID=9490 RepID=A0ABQ9UKL1_SAGOE|nr:hypothetical protein P7K49_023040 [Saguinus oedipus]
MTRKVTNYSAGNDDAEEEAEGPKEKDGVFATRSVPPLFCLVCDAKKGGILIAGSLKTWTAPEQLEHFD